MPYFKSYLEDNDYLNKLKKDDKPLFENPDPASDPIPQENSRWEAIKDWFSKKKENQDPPPSPNRPGLNWKQALAVGLAGIGDAYSAYGGRQTQGAQTTINLIDLLNKERREEEKRDVNSQISKEYRDLLQRTGLFADKDITGLSAYSIEKGLPLLKEKYESDKLIEAKKEKFGLDQQEIDERIRHNKEMAEIQRLFAELRSQPDPVKLGNLKARIMGDITKSKEYQDYKTTNKTVQNLIKAANTGSPYSDLSTLFDYMRSLDPTSVVREGEQETFRKTGSLSDKVSNALNKIATGQTLLPEQRQEIIDFARKRLGTSKNSYDSFLNPYRVMAAQQNYDLDEIIRSLDPESQTSSNIDQFRSDNSGNRNNLRNNNSAWDEEKEKKYRKLKAKLGK